MKILVTGGAGYIGSHAVVMLKAKGYQVVVVDNLSTGFKHDQLNAIPFYEINLQDKEALMRCFEHEQFDAVMHFAAFSLVGESMRDPLKYYYNNVEGTRVLIEVMNHFKVKHIVFSSTAAVYGETKAIPIKETATLMPKNPYGATKKTMEEMLEWTRKTQNFNYVALRYFNVAGAYHDGSIGENHNPETHLIPNVIKAVLNKEAPLKLFGDDYDTPDGTAIRDYIHVEDLIDAHIKALEYLKTHNQSNQFNLGSGEGYSVKAIIETTMKVTKEKVPYEIHPRREGDPAILIASYEKAKKHLNWSPKLGLENMIQSAYEYYKRGAYE